MEKKCVVIVMGFITYPFHILICWGKEIPQKSYPFPRRWIKSLWSKELNDLTR